ncbi:hypothetical protein J3F84DRAFT_194651 [Trichoderma pleuroticola]
MKKDCKRENGEDLKEAGWASGKLVVPAVFSCRSGCEFTSSGTLHWPAQVPAGGTVQRTVDGPFSGPLWSATRAVSSGLSVFAGWLSSWPAQALDCAATLLAPSTWAAYRGWLAGKSETAILGEFISRRYGTGSRELLLLLPVLSRWMGRASSITVCRQCLVTARYWRSLGTR